MLITNLIQLKNLKDPLRDSVSVLKRITHAEHINTENLLIAKQTINKLEDLFDRIFAIISETSELKTNSQLTHNNTPVVHEKKSKITMIEPTFISAVAYITKPSYSITDIHFIQKAIRYIEENMGKNVISKKSFADHMFLSQTKLYYLLLEITNLSPCNFINKVRLDFAAKMLMRNEYSITEIAEKAGFGDAKYFSTTFKKQFGKSPKQFALECKSIQKNRRQQAINNKPFLTDHTP